MEAMDRKIGPNFSGLGMAPFPDLSDAGRRLESAPRVAQVRAAAPWA
jgi:hypothetical protein